MHFFQPVSLFHLVLRWSELGVLLSPGHDKQREGPIREEPADSDGAEGLRGTRPQPAGEQLRSREHLVLHQRGGHGGGVRRAGLPAAQPLRRQEENAHVTPAEHLGLEWEILKFWRVSNQLPHPPKSSTFFLSQVTSPPPTSAQSSRPKNTLDCLLSRRSPPRLKWPVFQKNKTKTNEDTCFLT